MRFILPFIFIAGAIGIFIGYTNPLYTEAQSKQVEYSQLKAANDQAAKLRVVRDKLTADRSSIAPENISRLQKALPDSVENVGLIIDINNIAKRYGMSIKGAKVSDASTEAQGVGPGAKPYGSMTINFTVTTLYENFLIFLNDLESSLRILDVTGVTFSSNKIGTYDFNVTIQTYWLK